jgi:hypothetical protein
VVSQQTERATLSQEKRFEALELRAPQSERLTRVETKLEAVTEGITEIKTIPRAGTTLPPKAR